MKRGSNPPGVITKAARDPSQPTQNQLDYTERMNEWLYGEIKKMLLDPDSAINHVISLRLEVMMQQIEKDTPEFVKEQIQELRIEITQQQEKRETSWLKKLMSW